MKNEPLLFPKSVNIIVPQYIYRNPNTNELIEIIQSIHEEHRFIDKEGLEWIREFTVPQANISSTSNLNPFDSKGFSELTKNKKGNYGNLLDLSKELSEKREKMAGKDDIKEKMYKDYSKLRPGHEHPLKKKEKLDKLKKEGVSLKLK